MAEQLGCVWSPRSARGEWLGRADRRDEVVNAGAGCGGVGFIVDERFMRGGLGDMVGFGEGGRWSAPAAIEGPRPVSAVRTMSGLPFSDE